MRRTQLLTNMNMLKALFLSTFCLLAACQNNETEHKENTPEKTAAITQQNTKTQTETCPVLDSRNWHAWIDRYSSSEGMYRLNISGQLDLPTPGYSVNWKAGPLDRANPPGQRIMLELTPPQDMVIQVISPTDVSFKLNTPIIAFREVIILCGDKLLATLPDVTPME